MVEVQAKARASRTVKKDGCWLPLRTAILSFQGVDTPDEYPQIEVPDSPEVENLFALVQAYAYPGIWPDFNGRPAVAWYRKRADRIAEVNWPEFVIWCLTKKQKPTRDPIDLLDDWDCTTPNIRKRIQDADPTARRTATESRDAAIQAAAERVAHALIRDKKNAGIKSIICVLFGRPEWAGLSASTLARIITKTW
ncbi:MAG: hypothetical protein HQL87_07700 [Magnetococcales bacterium]|nr:hypothetical protein [Magnetococcales bacterium]